jgi:class 3 adenylate cyclase
MISSPRKEPIDDIYKSGKFKHLHELTKMNKKKRQSIIKPPPQNNDKYNTSNNNNFFNTSKSNELSKQRRLSLYNMFPLNINEKKEEEEKKVNPIIQKIINFESSFVGYVIIILIGTIGLLAYDFKNSIPNRNETVYLIILGVLTLYHIFDFVFRNIFYEKSVGTFYFKLQTFSVITLIFDFGMPIFILFRFIFLKTINKDKKYLYWRNQEIILYILGFLQSFKYIRFIKVYLMINKLAREIEKKQKYKEAIIESKKKAQKGNKSIVMPNNQQRLSKIKTFNITNMSAFKSLNIGKNENQSISNTANNNNSIINSNNNNNKVNSNNNKNENTNANITNHVSKKDLPNNNNINDINIKKVNQTNIMNENTSIIPLNSHPLSPVNKSNFLNKSIFTNFKDETTNDKSKMQKIMEKINQKFQQNRNANRLNNGICQLLIIMLILISALYHITKGDFIYGKENNYQMIIHHLNDFINTCTNLNKTNCNKLLLQNINSIINQVEIKDYPIIQIENNYEIIYHNESLSNETNDYYYGEYSYFYSKDNTNNNITLLVLQNRNFYINSTLNILKLISIFICVYIICIRMNKDLNLLILKPLNDINKVIDKVSKDPVNNKIISELRLNFESRINNFNDKKHLNYEMKVIESTLIRTSGLIAVGYGEAGSEIIKKFIKGNEGFDPMASGNKIEAIFGFCFIHDFAAISEVFEEKTMPFVNHICEIVHSCVDKFNGYTNKNIGDCFLLAWKVKSKDIKLDNNTSNINPNQNDELTLLADCALLAFLNIFKKINKSRKILSYRKDPDIIKRFGNKYSVALGFGLHYGWGIEGAIGSHHKIDCSYLSPNVNIAARLETATNIYGVDILFSGEFYNLLSDFMKQKCRKIDVVTLKGSEKPIDLYTVDLNKNIKPGKLMSKKDRMSLREKMDYYGQKKKKLWKKYKNGQKGKSI